MSQADDQVYCWNGCLYVPVHAVLLAAGPFLSVSPDWVEQHVELPPDFRHGVRDRYVGGVGMHRDGLAAARVHGDSMIYRDVLDGDIERPRSSHRTEYENEIDWDDPVIVLHSYNPRVSPRRLDPSRSVSRSRNFPAIAAAP